MLAPLIGSVIPIVKYKWEEGQQKAFYEIKQKLNQETLLVFAGFENELYVYTGASNKKLGAVIMQEGIPLAFYTSQ
jgi:hypothetical protein